LAFAAVAQRQSNRLLSDSGQVRILSVAPSMATSG
jgi:hypothetical protein